MRIQVRASSQTKGVEQGWNNDGRVRLARFARAGLLRHALPISLLILRKKPTVLQSRGGRQRASVERRLGVVVGADCFTLTKTWNRKPY